MQPEEARCIALTTTLESTAEDFVLGLIRDRLGLRFPPARVRARENLDLGDGVFAGAYVDPISLDETVTLAAGSRRVFFAGSYTANSYAADSAEGACRSALYAVERLAASNPQAGRTWAMPRDLPSATTRAQKARRKRPPAHPNTVPNMRTTAAAWRLACLAGSLMARVLLLNLSGTDLPRSDSVIFIADVRDNLDAIVGLLTFRELRAHPRPVVVERAFSGFAGRALASIGALPAIPGSNATRNAVTAAIKCGESVAFSVNGHAGQEDLVAFEVAMATGVPIVPIASSWTHDQARRGRRLRPTAVVGIGPPVDSSRTNATQLHSLVHLRLEELEAAVRLVAVEDATRWKAIR